MLGHQNIFVEKNKQGKTVIIGYSHMIIIQHNVIHLKYEKYLYSSNETVY